MRYETLVLKRDLARWKARCRPVLAIDFHAPGASENDGIYCFLQKPGVSLEKYEEGKGWSDKIAAKLGPKFAAPSFGRIPKVQQQMGKQPILRHFCAAELDVCALSFETPYFSIKEHVLTMEDYPGGRSKDCRSGDKYDQINSFLQKKTPRRRFRGVSPIPIQLSQAAWD